MLIGILFVIVILALIYTIKSVCYNYIKREMEREQQ